MDKILENAVGQAPGLVVLIILVFAFLKRDKERDAVSIARDQFIRQMHEEHLLARKESRDAIHDNAEATRENTNALGLLRSTVEAVTRK